MTVMKFCVLIRACGAIEPCPFVAYFLSCFLQKYPIFTLPRKVTSIFITWRVLGSSEGRRYGKSEGVVKVLKEFSKATDMAAGGRSGVYRAHLCGQGLSSKIMGGRFKYGIPKSYVKGLFKQS